MAETLSKKKTQSQTPSAPVETKDESLEVMRTMIAGQNWQGYLHFRHMYFSHGGRQGDITKMIKSLPDELQLVYGRYFQSHKEVIQRVRTILEQENTVKIAEQQARWAELSKVRAAERQAQLEERSKAEKSKPTPKIKSV